MTENLLHQNDLLIQISVYYLDDNPIDLANFKKKVDNFNNRPESYYIDLQKIKLVTTTDPSEVMSLLIGSNYDVFVCDHNMPENKGLELIIKYLKSENPNTIFVLYTGIDSADLKNECKENDILFFVKSEQFETLLSRIVKKLDMINAKEVLLDPQQRFYQKIAKDLIHEMQEIEKLDPDFIIQIGEREFRPSRMIKEINSQSEYGMKFLDGYIEGLKFFKDK
jgi:CheY-like chemotaxis protein